MSNAAVVCMPTLTSHYNVVLHHFVGTVCCVMAYVSCPLSVCSRVYQCVLSAWCTTTVLPSPFRGVHCTPSKSLATAVCVPLSLLSHYHSTSPTPSATPPYPTPATVHCTHTHCTLTTHTHNTRTAHVALCHSCACSV